LPVPLIVAPYAGGEAPGKPRTKAQSSFPELSIRFVGAFALAPKALSVAFAYI
jgi:hypothetical protein